MPYTMLLPQLIVNAMVVAPTVTPEQVLFHVDENTANGTVIGKVIGITEARPIYESCTSEYI